MHAAVSFHTSMAFTVGFSKLNKIVRFNQNFNICLSKVFSLATQKLYVGYLAVSIQFAVYFSPINFNIPVAHRNTKILHVLRISLHVTYNNFLDLTEVINSPFCIHLPKAHMCLPIFSLEFYFAILQFMLVRHNERPRCPNPKRQMSNNSLYTHRPSSEAVYCSNETVYLLRQYFEYLINIPIESVFSNTLTDMKVCALGETDVELFLLTIKFTF
jgi:hypothetical protein